MARLGTARQKGQKFPHAGDNPRKWIKTTLVKQNTSSAVDICTCIGNRHVDYCIRNE